MKKINDYLNEELNGLELCSGANADVYILDENYVLKKSWHKFDAFRELAKLPLLKRNAFSFQPIIETTFKKNDRYYLLKRLYPIDFNEKEKEDLFYMNIIEGNLFDYDRSSNRIKDIYHKISNLIDILNSEKNISGFELDLKEENIMQDLNGNIFLTDPVSEIIFEY